MAELGDETGKYIRKVKIRTKAWLHLFTGIDIFEGKNTFVYCDEASRKLFEKAIGKFKFDNYA